MWMSKTLVGILEVAKDSVDETKAQLAVVKAERDILKDQLRAAQINSDFFRMQINSLQMERTELLRKAHGIIVPTPQIQTRMQIDPALDPNNFSFEDLGDEVAGKLGLPVYEDR